MNSDTTPLTLGYALGAIGFAAAFILLAVVTVAVRSALTRWTR